jgi:hypothetical protein
MAKIIYIKHSAVSAIFYWWTEIFKVKETLSILQMLNFVPLMLYSYLHVFGNVQGACNSQLCDSKNCTIFMDELLKPVALAMSFGIQRK